MRRKSGNWKRRQTWNGGICHRSSEMKHLGWNACTNCAKLKTYSNRRLRQKNSYLPRDAVVSCIFDDSQDSLGRRVSLVFNSENTGPGVRKKAAGPDRGQCTSNLPVGLIQALLSNLRVFCEAENIRQECQKHVSCCECLYIMELLGEGRVRRRRRHVTVTQALINHLL